MNYCKFILSFQVKSRTLTNHFFGVNIASTFNIWQNVLWTYIHSVLHLRTLLLPALWCTREGLWCNRRARCGGWSWPAPSGRGATSTGTTPCGSDTSPPASISAWGRTALTSVFSTSKGHWYFHCQSWSFVHDILNSILKVQFKLTFLWSFPFCRPFSYYT